MSCLVALSFVWLLHVPTGKVNADIDDAVKILDDLDSDSDEDDDWAQDLLDDIDDAVGSWFNQHWMCIVMTVRFLLRSYYPHFLTFDLNNMLVVLIIWY